MPRFTDRFLDEVRAAVPISSVVGRTVRLKKKSAQEWLGVDDPSFTCSDKLQIFHDFGSTNPGGKPTGNVFDWVMWRDGCTFPEAVEQLAGEAGISLPRATNGDAKIIDRREEPPPGDPRDAAPAQRRGPDKRIVEVYPYVDADDVLRYEVVRREWVGKEGKPAKDFLQRRPVPGRPGEHAWGLKEGEHVQGRSGDWYLLNDDRESWDGPRMFIEGAPHALYRLPALREEMAQDPGDRRLIIVCEGERKVHVHERWGQVATCNSGGAENWQPHHAAELLGADVVIEADNDAAGRKGAEKRAASLRGIAARVRVLDWGRAWPGAKAKADVVDFDKAGKTTADWWRIVDALEDWRPSAPESGLGAVRFSDLDRPGRRRLQWLVKGVVTAGDVSVWYGHPGCGKSYLVTDCAFAINRGIRWMGNRVRPGLVIYQAGEGGVGFEDRMRAYRQVHGRSAVNDSAFVMWPERVNLYQDDADVKRMIEEANAWAAYYEAPVGMLIVDTISAATTGADENTSKDMSTVVDRAWAFAKATGAHVALIHHVPKGGHGPRGSGVLTGNVSTLIEVMRTEGEIHRDTSGADTKLRDVRRMRIIKQKDGPDGRTWDFVLKQVIIGKDEDGDDVPQCVVQQVNERADEGREVTAPAGWSVLKPNNVTILRALQKAIAQSGAVPQQPVSGVPEYTKCVRVGDWIGALSDLKFANDPGDPPTEKYPYGAKLYGRCKKAIERTYSEYGWIEKLNLIGKAGDYVWRTTRRALGVDELPGKIAQRPEQDMIAAPGEDADDLTLPM